MDLPAKLRVLIVDDEAPARRRLTRLLQKQAEVEIVGEADSGQAAALAIEQLEPELVFLDIQLPGIDGFGALDLLQQVKMPQIVFVTAHEEFAVRAFDVRALDYLLKPFSEQRLQDVVRRARERVDLELGRDQANMAHVLEELRRGRSYPQRILLSGTDRALLLEVDSVLCIEAERNYATFHCGSETHKVRATLTSILERLDPGQFVRINRSAAVRLNAIQELIPWFHGEYKVILKSGLELVWSRRYVMQMPESFRLQ